MKVRVQRPPGSTPAPAGGAARAVRPAVEPVFSHPDHVDEPVVASGEGAAAAPHLPVASLDFSDAPQFGTLAEALWQQLRSGDEAPSTPPDFYLWSLASERAAAISAVTTEIFGHPVTPAALGRLAGASLGEEVRVNVLGDRALRLTARPWWGGSRLLTIERGANGITLEHATPRHVAEAPDLQRGAALPPPAERTSLFEGQRVTEVLWEYGLRVPARGATVQLDQPARVLEMSRAVFGRELSANDFADLAAAPEGARVHVSVAASKTAHLGADTVELNVVHPQYREYKRTFSRNAEGELEVEHDVFQLTDGLPRGTGTQVLLDAVETYRRYGARRIRTIAATSLPHWVGTLVWPKLGFNGALPRATLEALAATDLPDEVKQAQTVFELLATEEGARWYQENPPAFLWLTFDLADGSLSRQMLEAFAEARGLAPRAVSGGRT
ncbi:MAG: hypothetical protein IPJ65_40300 [Archangiaceae bacterium]|nr:hypothetical protein [Archangiaceae bacterium]